MQALSKIKLGTKIKYGIADIGLALQQSAIQFFMLFYLTDVAKINPAIAGMALLLSKLTWDMINDPIFGYLSDKTRSRWGRRRPYMFFAAVPLALSFWLLFSLPQGMQGFAAFIAIFGAYILFDTFHTMISMAYYAMTAELTTDYDERTSITSVRMGFSIVGYILGAAATTIIAGVLRDSAGFSLKASWSTVALIFGTLSMIVVLITAFTVKNKPVVNDKPSELKLFTAIGSTFKNKPFRILMIISALVSISFTLITSLLPYYLIYQLNMEAQLSFVMLTLLLTVALFIYPTKLISDKIGKGKTYAFGLTLSTFVFIAFFFLPKGPTMMIYVLAVLAGIGLTGQWVFPGSMVPDVVEIDEKQTGERREGIFFGIWAMVGKITGAFAIALGGWALELFGYVEGVAQTPQALLGIRLFFAIAPAVLFVVCIPLLLKYPINKESHKKLLEEIQSNKAKTGT